MVRAVSLYTIANFSKYGKTVHLFRRTSDEELRKCQAIPVEGAPETLTFSHDNSINIGIPAKNNVMMFSENQ